MGLLVAGEWVDQWYDTEATDGEFVRSNARFRNWITVDGAAGPSGEAGFKAQADRYHLYVSLACPWAHRTLIFRQLKGLQDLISVSVVNPVMREQGWTFQPAEGVIADPLLQAEFLHQLYTHADPRYSGRVTVPLLWDKQQDKPVSNESSEIIRMFNRAFDGFSGVKAADYYPESLRADIDAMNARIYDAVNNGVYKAGFATRQQAYETAVGTLFDSLDWLDQHLAANRYLLGETLTEADWRLFATLIRFDSVYYGHFKCNIRQIESYPNLSEYIRELYQWPGIASTVNMHHIKTHYYASHPTVNPTGIVPVGPFIDYARPHRRG